MTKPAYPANGAPHQHELEALLSAAERLNAAADANAVLQHLLETAAAWLTAELAAVFTREGDRALCRHWHTAGAWPSGPFALPLENSIAGWVFRHARPYRAAHCAAAIKKGWPPEAPFRPTTALAVPVLARDGAAAAVLALFDRHERTPFSEDNLRLLQGMAHHAAIAWERARLTAELQRTTQALALLEERARVAMDLHDGAIQSLYGVMLNLAAQARTLGGEQSAARTELERSVDQLAAVIQEIRKYITGLWAQELGARGLPAGLRALAHDLQANAHIDTSLELEVEPADLLEPEAIASLLQLAREAVSNVIRHAAAGSVSIRLHRAPGSLVLSIRDDGRGFDPRAVDSGHGLRSMAERARRLGGALTVRSHAGQGTEVRVAIPLGQTHKGKRIREKPERTHGDG